MPRIRADAVAFARLLTNLQPTGDAWPADADSVQQQAILAFASTFAALNDRANQLIDEAFPQTTYELLPQWEASLGLPDKCTPLQTTVLARQNAVVAKLISRGGQSVPYLIGVAAALGVAITISQFTSFRADANRADDPDNDDTWSYAWQVNMPAAIIDYYFCADTSFADEPLDLYETGVVQCRLNQVAPAQGILIFDYLSAADGEDLLGADEQPLYGADDNLLTGTSTTTAATMIHG